MKNAIVFSMIVLGLVGYLNLGQMIDADPWGEVNARSAANQHQVIEKKAVDQPGDEPLLRPWPDPGYEDGPQHD